MAFTEDLTIFTADFGDDGTLGGAPVRGIYDGPGATASLGGMAAVATDPQYQLPTAQVPASSYGATLVILTGLGAGNYKVREHQPDGTGMSLLLLTKA
jgi:hypothetical protein